MDPEQVQKFFAAIDVPLTHPKFLDKLFDLAVKERKVAQTLDGDNLKRVCAEEYEDLSRRLDSTQIQDSCSVRNVLRTRRLANLLITDKGELNVALLPKVIALTKNYLYSLGPQRQFDAIRQDHVIAVLTLLQNNKDLVKHLQGISKPYSHPLAEQIIRDTLQLPAGTMINDAYTRRAALSAWLCYLRQNIGSCFATAPAIIVQQEQPELFLTDLKELMATGRIKRTFGGIEYSVPLSVTWGAGDSRKLFVLSTIDDQTKNGIWESPGLIAAFEAIGLINADSPNPEKIENVHELIRVELRQIGKTQPAIITSAEDLIRRVLMRHLQITAEDLQAYENRPRGMIHSSLMMQMPHSSSGGMGGKGESCATFHLQFDNALNAFKSLADNALLKAWEFSIASFAETKAEFTRWNLYSSLGLGPNEPGGIGECLFQILKQHLEHWNRRVSEIQTEYEMVYTQLKQLEGRIRSASSDRDAQWIRAEYQSHTNEFHTLQEIRDEAHSKAGRFAHMFDLLIEAYDRLFPKYFQEVFDADMHEVDVGPYDDSPAGFRLFYKHGRANTSQWTRIRNPTEFIDMLANFFTSTEREIAAMPELEGLETEISEIVTGIVNHVRTKQFLETSFHRMAIAHKMPAIRDPLENLEKISKKPWAYTSGGTINTLLSCYYRREQKPTEINRWVENPLELLVFLADTLKQIPYKKMDDFRQDPELSMLIHSPTHAFILKPGYSPFKQTWNSNNDTLTYTWVRDTLVKPMERFSSNMEVDEEMMDFLVEELSEIVPRDYRHYFKKTFMHMHGKISVGGFRDIIVDKMNNERGLMFRGQSVLSTEDIDGSLYSLLPLFPRMELKDRVQTVISKLPDIDTDMQKQMLEIVDEYSSSPGSRPLISAQGLQDIILALLILVLERTATSIDYQGAIALIAQQEGFAMPAPILIADTNWVRDYFGFVVNPGTEKLELWRIDHSGRIGRPMSSWRQWLDGSRKEPQWGVYPQTYEYHM